VICIVLISFLQQASKDTHPKSFVQYYGITLINLMHLFNEMYFALRIVGIEVIQEDKTLLIVGLVLEASWKLFVLNELSCANLIKLCHMLLIIYILSRLVTPTECFFMSIKVFGQGLFCLFLLRAKKESLEKEKNQRKSLNKNKTRDFKTLVEILDHLSEGITLFDSKGEIKFVNSHLKRILDFEKKLTMDNLNVTLSDLKFSHSFLKNLRNISKEEQINAKKARSHDLVEETSESFDEVDFSKEKLKNVSCFWDLFTLYTKNSETGSAISNYTNFFQARYYHKFTHEWRNIELQAHLLQSNNEKQLLILN